MLRRLNFLVLTTISITLCLPVWAGGKLMIVGGALESSNVDVYQKFIDAVPAKGAIAIIPAASGKPVVYAQKFQRDLLNYGVAKDRIKLVPVAMVDDTSTEEDESLWQKNAYSEDLIRSLKNVQGFWFVGGDQTRITQLLIQNNSPSPLLKFIRTRLSAGAVVGGTSAGAAIMSSQMIAGGDSVSALLALPSETYVGMESQEQGELHWQAGLNFLPGVLVDQHFDRKARLGRLAVAMCRLGVQQGLGVDENTAAFIDLDKAELEVLGRGNVVWLDGRRQRCSLDHTIAKQSTKKHSMVSDMSISVLAPGDIWQWQTQIFKTSHEKLQTVGQESFSGASHVADGFGVANARLDESLGFDLLDNKDVQRLERLTLANFDDNDYLIRFNFKQTMKSQGYWGYLDGTKDSYSAIDVDFSIELQRLAERILP